MKKFFMFGLLALFLASGVQAQEETLVPWISNEGIARFERSEYKLDFFKLAPQFEAQFNRAYCGPTSVAMVLNALRSAQLQSGVITLPKDEWIIDSATQTTFDTYIRSINQPLRYFGFNRYTQNNVLNLSYRPEAKPTKTRNRVIGEPKPGTKEADLGLKLAELHDLLLAHGVKSEMVVVDNDAPNNEEIRKRLVENLGHVNDYVIVNFDRATMGQKGGGHISPLGAYDEASDSFLIVDVNPGLAAWVWVKSDALIKAMRTKDITTDGATYRGFLLISE